MGLISVLTLVVISLIVELLMKFVYNVNGQREELRRKIAKQKEAVREFNPQTEYARYIKADRELKKMQEELPLVGEGQIPTWLAVLSYAPYVFVILHSLFYAPVLGVDSEAAASLNARWWWPLSSIISSPFIAAIIFAYVSRRGVSVLIRGSGGGGGGGSGDGGGGGD